MITGFNHTSFTVPDLERAVGFWSGTNMLRTNLDLEFRVFEDSDSKLEE